MVKDQIDYDTGDWLIHVHFGAGQVVGTEVKQVSGEEKTYYKIETSASTLWLPVDALDESKIRPLSQPDEFEQAIHELRGPTKEMDPNANERKKRIAEVAVSNLPALSARLIRDLWDRLQEEGSLYDWEREAWRTLSSRFVQEWALCEEITAEEARMRMNNMLRRVVSAENGGEGEKPEPRKGLLVSLSSEDEKWSEWHLKAIGHVVE